MSIHLAIKILVNYNTQLDLMGVPRCPEGYRFEDIRENAARALLSMGEVQALEILFKSLVK